MIVIQVAVSLFIVAGVLWFMWKLPYSGESLFGWGAPLALLSAWAGLLAVVLSAGLWFLPYPDVLVLPALLALDPGSIGCGVLVLWIYRQEEQASEQIEMQRLQARVGIGLGMLAVAIGYVAVMTTKTPFTPIGIG